MIVKRRKSVFLTADSKQVHNKKVRRRRPATPHFSQRDTYTEKKLSTKSLWIILCVAGGVLVAAAVLWAGKRLYRQAADPVGLLAWGTVLAIVLAIGAAVFFSIYKQKKDRNGTREPSHSRYMRVKGTFGQMQEHVYRKNTRLRR